VKIGGFDESFVDIFHDKDRRIGDEIIITIIIIIQPRTS